MRIGVPKETFPGERRVALVPSLIAQLKKAGVEVGFEAGAGVAAGFPDRDFADKGAVIVGDRAELFGGRGRKAAAEQAMMAEREAADKQAAEELAAKEAADKKAAEDKAAEEKAAAGAAKKRPRSTKNRPTGRGFILS